MERNPLLSQLTLNQGKPPDRDLPIPLLLGIIPLTPPTTPVPYRRGATTRH